jgi:hypothetical protein
LLPYFTRLKFAFRTFFSILDRHRIPDDVAAALAPSVTPPPQPQREAAPAVADTTGPAVQLLALFQRDGRLVDFLMEDLTGYDDAQIGAAVRDVHSGCHRTLKTYLTLASVLNQDEGQSVTIDKGVDAATVKLIGNVAGQPPFRGVLRHRGWLVSRIELPPLPQSSRLVIAPAEVEVR